MTRYISDFDTKTLPLDSNLSSLRRKRIRWDYIQFKTDFIEGSYVPSEVLGNEEQNNPQCTLQANVATSVSDADCTNKKDVISDIHVVQFKSSRN